MHGMILIILAVLSWPFHLDASTPNTKTLVFEFPLKPESELYKVLTTAFRDILQKQGYELRMISLPLKRGLQGLKSGQVDGSIGRMGNLSKFLHTDQLIRLDTPVAFSSISRWCRKDLEKTTSSLNLGSRLGTLALNLLKDHIDLKRVQLQEIAEEKSIVQMLKSGRLDCVLSSDLLLGAEGITEVDLKYSERFDLLAIQVYPWIHQRHEKLKSILESGLKSYPFPEDFRKKFLQPKHMCDGKFNVLCPDGVIFKSKVDLS